MWKDIHIKNDLRNALNISYTDYIYLDHTYKTQNNIQLTNNGYCDFSARKTASVLGMSKGCVQGIEKRMKERGFLEKSVCGTMRKTTDEWNQYFDVSGKEKDTEKWSKEDKKSILEKHSNRTKKVHDCTKKVHDCTKKVHDTIYNKNKENKKEVVTTDSANPVPPLSSISDNTKPNNDYLLKRAIIEDQVRKVVKDNFSNAKIFEMYPNAVKTDVPTLIEDYLKYWIDEKHRKGCPKDGGKRERYKWVNFVKNSFKLFMEVLSNSNEGETGVRMELEESDQEVLDEICDYWFKWFRKEVTVKERNIISNRIMKNGLQLELGKLLVEQAYQATEELQKVKIIFEERFEKFVSYVPTSRISA